MITHEWKYDLYLLRFPNCRLKFYRTRSEATRIMLRYIRRFHQEED